MASVQTSSYEGRYLKLTVSVGEQRIYNGVPQSRLDWVLKSTGGSSSYYTIYNCKVDINGTTKKNWGTVGWSEKVFPAKTGTFDSYANDLSVWINHNSDGTHADVGFALHGKVYSSGDENKTGSIALPTIPVASEPSCSSSSVTTGGSVTIYTNKASDSFTHKIYYTSPSTGNLVQIGGDNIVDSVVWNSNGGLTSSLFDTSSLYDKDYVNITITCKTYQNGTELGTKTTSIRVNLQSDVKPTLTTPTFTKRGTDVNVVSPYVIGKNYPEISMTASGILGSTIKKYYYKYNNGSEREFDSLTEMNSYLSGKSSSILEGSKNFIFYVKDSRGRISDTKTVSINGAAYSLPSITTFNYVGRCNNNGSNNVNGVRAKFNITCAVKNINDQNKRTIKMRHKETSASTYGDWYTVQTERTVSASDATYTVTGKNSYEFNTSLSFATNKSYDVQLLVKDAFTNGESYKQTIVMSSFDILNVRTAGDGIAFGKKSESAIFDCNLPATFRQPITPANASVIKFIGNYLYPVGSVYMSLYSTDPGTLFGGEWVKLTDGFLYASSAATGGENYWNGSTASGNGNGTGQSTGSTTSGLPAHTHNVTLTNTVDPNNTSTAKDLYGKWRSKQARFPGSSEHSGIITEWEVNQSTYWSSGGGKDTNTVGWYINARHGHTGTTDSAGTENGSAHTHTIPYRKVHMWVRKTLAS